MSIDEAIIALDTGIVLSLSFGNRCFILDGRSFRSVGG